MMNRYAVLGAMLVSTAAACAVAPQDESSSTGSALSRALDCHAANLTPSQVATCIDQLKQQIPQPTYCDGGGGGAVYECGDFSDSFCDALHGSNYACGEVALGCTDPNDPTAGHVVSVVFMGGSCYAVEPQPTGSGSSIVGGPWPAENGSCNTFPPSVANAICTEVGLGPATCTQFFHYGHPYPHGSALDDCRPIQQAAALAE